MTRSHALDGIEREFGVLIRRVRRVIGERARAVHEGLQPSSYLLLSHLAEVGPSRSSVFVDAFDIDKGAISRQVQHLVELGLVERAPDPADGRAMLISATPDAVARLAAVQAERRRFLDARLDGWSDEELEMLVSMLGRYNAALEGAAVPA